MGRLATCDCGECTKCKWRVYMRKWYALPENTERARESSRQSRLRRLDVVRAYDRARGYRPGTREKHLARKAARNAVYAGRLVREPCEVCGAMPTDAHHDDYTKRLEVRWLCERHHGEAHRSINP